MTEPATDATASSFVPVPAAHVSAEPFDGETVLYDTIGFRPVLLNVSAAAVWAAIDGRRTVAEIALRVASQFGAEPAVVLADVSATVDHFGRLGLLTIPPP